MTSSLVAPIQILSTAPLRQVPPMTTDVGVAMMSQASAVLILARTSNALTRTLIPLRFAATIATVISYVLGRTSKAPQNAALTALPTFV